MCRDKPAKDLLQSCQSGDQAAAEELYRRYSQRLWRLAEREISKRLRSRVEPDDILQSVFRTFFRRTSLGEFAVDHSGALWQLLVRITLSKVLGQVERHRAAKRDVQAEWPSPEDSAIPLLDRNPSAADAAGLVDEIEYLGSKLKPPGQEILALHLEGHTKTDIARQVACSRRFVTLTLERVKVLLEQRLAKFSKESE